jgi:arylsulfatase A-like enzyme
MLDLVALSLLVAAPPDFSEGYFPRLDRPNVTQTQIERGKGPVILIVVDAMRPDRLTPYGFERDTSPNLKALADDGILFTNYYVNGNWTRPSTASLVTGLMPARHAVERDQDKLAEQFVTLAEILDRTGIPTGAVVGNGNAGSAFGLGRGFHFYADTVKHWEGLPSADQVTELAVPFVREHKDEPFFLMLFFVDPHDPYHAPGDYENKYVSDSSVPLVRSPHWELGNYSDAEVERMKATYDGAVRYTDDSIGKFIGELKRLGIYDDATLIVTSDHGEAFGEHGVFLHAHHMYDEIIRAPLIIRAPKMSARGVYNHYLFQTVDLMPTIVRAYGAKVPEDLPGADIFRHLSRPGLVDPYRTVICEFYNFGISRRMIRTYRHKVIYADPTDEEQFMATVKQRRLLPSVSFTDEQVQMYDIGRDPLEMKNLYDEKRGPPGDGWKWLLRILKKHRDGRLRESYAQTIDHLDPETRRDLKALGYIQ